MAETRTLYYEAGDALPAPSSPVRVVSWAGAKESEVTVSTGWLGGEYKSLPAGSDFTMPWYPLAITVGSAAKAFLRWGYGQFHRRAIIDWGQTVSIFAQFVDVDIVFPLGLVLPPRAFRTKESFSCGVSECGQRVSRLATLTESDAPVLSNTATRPRPVPWEARYCRLYCSRYEDPHNGQNTNGILLIGHWNGAIFRPYAQTRYTGGAFSPRLVVGAGGESPILPQTQNAYVVQNETNTDMSYQLEWEIDVG
jgi:hypothetical protein